MLFFDVRALLNFPIGNKLTLLLYLFIEYREAVAAAALQCDQIGQFLLYFGQLFKSCGNTCFAQIAHILGKFCKVVKIFNFSSEITFGQLLSTFGGFLLVTLTAVAAAAAWHHEFADKTPLGTPHMKHTSTEQWNKKNEVESVYASVYANVYALDIGIKEVDCVCVAYGLLVKILSEDEPSKTS